MLDERRQVKSFVKWKIEYLTRGINENDSKAFLAKLRRGIGKEPGSIPELWGIMFEGAPENLMGIGESPTYSERAIHLALTLFALHQQGKDHCVDEDGVSLGCAIARMVEKDQDRESAYKKRFDAVATANSLNEIAHHIRGIIQLLKAKDISLDYSLLADDLYRYQFPELRDSVRLRWGRDYYKIKKLDKEINTGKAGNDQ